MTTVCWDLTWKPRDRPCVDCNVPFRANAANCVRCLECRQKRRLGQIAKANAEHRKQTADAR